MKIKRLLLPLFAAAMSSCTMETPENVMEHSGDISNESPALVPCEMIVKFSGEMADLIEADLEQGLPATKSSELNSVMADLGIQSLTRMFPNAGEYEQRTREAGLHRYYKAVYSPAVTRTRASERFSGIPGVEEVEPVRKIKSTAIFNDPYLSRQWHYYNDGSLTSSHRSGADINVLQVWETYTTGSSDVIVAIVDGGIDYEHEDLAANYMGGRNFYRNNSVVVAHDHGTHVAGTVGAVSNNGKGVSGIAGGDAANGIAGVKLLSCQIFEPNPDDPEHDFSGSGAEAIKWGADNGAVISQNSWGYVYETYEEAAAATIPSYLKAAIDYFIANAGKDASGKQVGPMNGGVVIFAAGNDARDTDPIGKYDPVISVGSIAPDFTRAYYSNYGDWVDIAAPGGSADYSDGQVYSTLPGNKYGWMQGTSMACPHVSGVAALMVSHFGGPGFSNETLKTKLLKGANANVLSGNSRIGPLLDAFGAFTYGGTIPPDKVTSATSSVISNTVSLTFNVTRDSDDVKAYGYTLVASKDRHSLDGIDFKNLPADVISESTLVGSLKAGEKITASISSLEFEQTYYVCVAGFDYNRNYSELSPVYTVVTEKNNPPMIVSGQDGELLVHAHETLRVLYEITEPDGHSLTVSFTPGSDAASAAFLPDGKYAVTIVGNISDPGKYQAVVTATDGYGLSSSSILDYRILENSAPEVIKEVEDMLLTMPGEKFTLDMDEYLHDPDGEQLSYSISISDRTVLHINPSGNILNATALDYGLANVTVVAADAKGLTCSLTFRVLVKDVEEDTLEIYPNPVSDYLNIGTGKETEIHVTVRSSAGNVMYDSVCTSSLFEPARIDMRSLAPGRYVVTVGLGGNTYSRNIVKL